MWLPVFACSCGASMASSHDRQIVCPSCGRRIASAESVFRCIEPQRLARLEPFLSQYRIVRQRDGYRANTADYYRGLPSARIDDPQRGIWTIRQRSFRRVCALLRGRARTGQPTVLDLGAGSGWLSYQLSKIGWQAVAVDLLTDERDGLGAHRYYDASFVCVQADFDALPFAPEQFDCIVFNASLHYAPDICATIRRIAPLLNTCGVLLVVDSPTFVHERDGLAMRARDRERLETEYHVAAPIQPGEGFLTFARLSQCAGMLNRQARYFRSADGVRRGMQRVLSATGIGFARPAQFGVWMAA